MAVGGLCSVDAVRGFHLTQHLRLWREKNNVTSEFHFSQLSRQKLDEYKIFFNEACGFTDTLSFKISLLKPQSIRRSKDETVRELYRHFIGRAIDHEIETKRVTLPRRISIVKDHEGETDAILISKIEEALKAYYVTKYKSQLTLHSITPLDSKKSDLIQLSDLFISSVCRIMNRKAEAKKNHKDELAEHIVSILGIDLSNKNNSKQDSSYVDFMG